MRVFGTVLMVLLLAALLLPSSAWSDERGIKSYRSAAVVASAVSDAEGVSIAAPVGWRGQPGYRHDGRHAGQGGRYLGMYRHGYGPGYPYGYRYYNRPFYPYRYYSPYYYGGGYYDRQGIYFGISGCFRSGSVRICVNNAYRHR